MCLYTNKRKNNQIMNYSMIVVKEENGYSARCIEYPGAITQGDTLDELAKNMEEAISVVKGEA
jgi:predicted RNase H-like HicB family nuclease